MSETEPPALSPAPSVRTAAISPVQATLAGFLAVALFHFGDIALLPLSSGGLALRARHILVDFGHVLTVALPTAGVVALIPALATRLRVRRSVASTAAVALAAGALGPIVLLGDLEGAYERLLPDHPDWLLWLGSSVLAQGVTACFVVGRFCARPRLRWAAVALGAALIAANAVVLQNGYPGAHVLLSASGATLIASSLSGARRFMRWGRGPKADAASAPRTLLSRVFRPANVAWALLAMLSAWSVVLPPSSGLQVELLARDTPLLFPWLRSVYAPPRARAVSIPPELRPSFERRAGRPDIAPSKERLLPEGPIVVVITIDALRFDVLEPRHRRAAPNLHEIREKSVYFAQARSSGSDTRYSMATLFTGMHQSMLRWTTKRGRRVSLDREKRPRFPELLQKAGVQTVGGLSATMLHPRQGIARGFDERLRTRKDAPDERSRSDGLTTRIIERLRAQGPEPLFLYTHFMDPHDPYDTHGRPATSKFDAYLIEVSVADENVGRIRRAIAELGLGRRTALIIGADHGEGFGEHRIFTHGKSFYDVLVRVPLMVEIPGVTPRTVDDFVALMDVGPTVLDLFGVPTPGHFLAETLTPYLVGRRGDPNRLILMEKATQSAMLFPDGLKVMDRRGAYELYDVRRDPDENNDLWERYGDESERRLALLEAYVRAHAGRRNAEPDLAIDE